MIKPDGVQRGLVGEIIKRFEQKGYKLVAMKMTSPGVEHMEKHYEDLKAKKLFLGLIAYMRSGAVVAMVWESAMGTIRGDFCVEVGRNICHGSDSVESANHEIGLWFPEGVAEWTSCQSSWIYE